MSAVPKLSQTLENGAVMTRQEFHEAYQECEGLERVELIEGIVYMPSPVKFVLHTEQQALMLVWLRRYAAKTPGLRAGGPATVFLDDDNEPEPDVLLFRTTPGWDSPDGHIAKVPELVVEIAASSRSRDLNQKKRAYARAGIREYIVWRVLNRAIDWFVLEDSKYVLRQADDHGRIESVQFPGLVLDVSAALAEDEDGMLAALR